MGMQLAGFEAFEANSPTPLWEETHFGKRPGGRLGKGAAEKPRQGQGTTASW